MNRQEIKLFHESSKDLERWITEIKSSWANPPKFNFGTEKIKHLAIICDGNRRAAERRRLNASFGHQAGVETIKGIAPGPVESGEYIRAKGKVSESGNKSKYGKINFN